MKCALGNALPVSIDVDKIKRDAWHKERILVVSLDDDRLDCIDREIIVRVGDYLYGKSNECKCERRN